MSDAFFEQPILNSPYAAPARHWELDADGQPTQQIIDTRRKAGRKKAKKGASHQIQRSWVIRHGRAAVDEAAGAFFVSACAGGEGRA